MRYIFLVLFLIGCANKPRIFSIEQLQRNVKTIQGVWISSNDTLKFYGDSIYNSELKAKGIFSITNQTLNQYIEREDEYKYILHQVFKLQTNKLTIVNKQYTR